MTQARTDAQCRASIECCDRADTRTDSVLVKLDPGEIVATSVELRQSNADLLSLRAAVRRVLEAEDAEVGPIGDPTWLRNYNAAMASMRAEMAGIDGEGGAQ